ncbi:MAG: DUF4375 domain-containing protein [Planctomycetes bacterium]|nr:DUF4375 domain-containing protein [Planctomycetota bacterium]
MVNVDEVVGTVAKLNDDDVEQFLFDCLENRFGREKLNASDYRFTWTLPPGYRVLTPTVWIESEVFNGGAGQYFWNRLVDFDPMTKDAIAAYEMIGATAQAASLRDCLQVFAPLELECRRIKDREVDGFLEWMEIWDGLKYLGDNPLFEYEKISAKWRIP